jgi:cytochrome c553
MKNRNDILNDLLAYAKEKGYNEYAYSFGVISTYLSDEDLADLERYVAKWRIEDKTGI